MSDFWSDCLSLLKQKLSVQQYDAWIRPLSAREADGKILVTAPSRKALEWVKEQYLPDIQKFAEQRGDMLVIEIDVGTRKPANGARSAAHNSSAPPTVPPTASAGTSAGASLDIRDDDDPAGAGDLREPATAAAMLVEPALSPRPNGGLGSTTDPTLAQTIGTLSDGFTFDTFVTGKANQFARAAALQVAENPGRAYNPLFLYGGTGLGKTHLVQAIGNFVHERNPAAVIRYIHAEKYVSDVVRAYQNKSFDAFKRFYHSLDLLLIDDIQFFSGKSRTQEEFFYAFNTLTDQRKQIVITCDTYPKKIEGMDDRLLTRFAWGLTVEIEPPELEMRVAILLKKAAAIDMDISEEVAFFVARHFPSNVRELEGALNRIRAYSRFNACTVSIDSARDALRDILAVSMRQVSIEQIQKAVADYFKMKVSEMHSKRRSRAVARPRQVAMALAKELTTHSLPDIGGAFGGRDHTTVLHACRQIARLRTIDTELGRDYQTLLQQLRH
ncbi:MAG: chromosomal replication initiator protein DnaA [Rhodocyclaceae bacterium]|nr:chromosomal replication initiator protein DnaA [Rhodocyclaceae bacterium]